MRKRINELFIPPKFEDKDKSRQASLLNSILIASILLTGFYIPILFLTDLNPVPGMIILSAMLVIFVGIYLVFRRGKVRIAASILMLVIWVITAVSSYFFDGVMGPSYVSLFLVVFSAGLLLGTEAAILYSAFTLSLGFVLLYLVNAGTLPQSLTPTTPQSFFGGVAINLVILVFFIALMNKNIRDSLSEAKKSQVELEESNKMLTETRNYLEETVEKNTRQLERRNKYLEAANMVARDTTSFLDPDELLQRVVTLISEQFDFYHVGIFIVDESNETAVLKAASSLGGQKMIARGHSLAVGKRGIVGFVTGIGQPRIAQNIGADQVHSATAELPETKSEMALPLKIRGEIIGAIDIQDTKENAFTDDDVLVLQKRTEE